MKSILVSKYVGPTTHKGSRIIVETNEGHRYIVPFDHAARNAHESAAWDVARRLAEELNATVTSVESFQMRKWYVHVVTFGMGANVG